MAFVDFSFVVASVEPKPGTRAALLGQLEVPEWPLTSAATLDDSSTGVTGDVSDSVSAELVVGTTGRVVPRTVRVIGHPAPAANIAFSENVPSLRFEPARIGNCAVPQFLIRAFPVRTI